MCTAQQLTIQFVLHTRLESAKYVAFPSKKETKSHHPLAFHELSAILPMPSSPGRRQRRRGLLERAPPRVQTRLLFLLLSNQSLSDMRVAAAQSAA